MTYICIYTIKVYGKNLYVFIMIKYKHVDKDKLGRVETNLVVY